MNDFTLFCLLVAIIGGAIWYIIAQKRKGAKCIGCSCGCSSDCSGDCSSSYSSDCSCDSGGKKSYADNKAE